MFVPTSNNIVLLWETVHLTCSQRSVGVTVCNITTFVITSIC